MSDDVIIALVGLISAIGGALASNLYAAAKNRLEAYQLAQEMQARPISVCGSGTAP